MPFVLEQQHKSNWCWNAVSVSVQRYFDPSSTLTQEKFAVEELGNVPDLDQGFYLEDALTALGKLDRRLPGALTFADIQRELMKGLPVCVHVAWYEGHSHYVVISGYRFSPAGDPQVMVSDPILPNSNIVVWDYNAFVFAYGPTYTNGEGYWEDTCLVEAR